MEERSVNELVKLTQAVKALSKSVERTLLTGTASGTGAMMVKSYRSLQNRAAELVPDDYFITETLKLEFEEDPTDDEMAAQVRLAVSQLLIYLEGLIKSERPRFEEVEDWQTLGRDLQEQIMTLTKRTLKRALKNVDFGFSDTDEDEPGDDGGKKKRVKVNINIGGRFNDLPEPPEPPIPPEPPKPPKPPVL